MTRGRINEGKPLEIGTDFFQRHASVRWDKATVTDVHVVGGAT